MKYMQKNKDYKIVCDLSIIFLPIPLMSEINLIFICIYGEQILILVLSYTIAKSAQKSLLGSYFIKCNSKHDIHNLRNQNIKNLLYVLQFI